MTTSGNFGKTPLKIAGSFLLPIVGYLIGVGLRFVLDVKMDPALLGIGLGTLLGLAYLLTLPLGRGVRAAIALVYVPLVVFALFSHYAAAMRDSIIPDEYETAADHWWRFGL